MTKKSVQKPTLKKAGFLWICDGCGVEARGKTSASAYSNWLSKIETALRGAPDALKDAHTRYLASFNEQKTYYEDQIDKAKTRCESEKRSLVDEIKRLEANKDRIAQTALKTVNIFGQGTDPKVLILLAMVTYSDFDPVSALEKLQKGYPIHLQPERDYRVAAKQVAEVLENTKFAQYIPRLKELSQKPFEDLWGETYA